MFEEKLRQDAERLLAELRAAGLKLATAESCTGGLICAVLTEIAGSSLVVDRGFVTYSNEAKTEMLGVPARLIADHGAVSDEVARAMVAGVLQTVGGADIAVSVTGIAGPGGGSPQKPVGLVYLAAGRRGKEPISRACRFGDVGRSQVRLESVKTALELVRSVIGA